MTLQTLGSCLTKENLSGLRDLEISSYKPTLTQTTPYIERYKIFKNKNLDKQSSIRARLKPMSTLMSLGTLKIDKLVK